MTIEFKTNYIENPQRTNKLGEQFEFYRTDEVDIRFRVMVKFLDEEGIEKKSTLGDGVLPLSEFVSWAGSRTDLRVPLFVDDDNGNPVETAILSTTVEWTPESIPDDYEPPQF